MKTKNIQSSHPLSRRRFIRVAGLGASALTLSSPLAFADYRPGGRKIRLGIVGGGFGTSFYFHEHPNCMVEAVSDLRKDRRDGLMNQYKCSKSYDSLEVLLTDPKIEAVFLATPVPDHARHTIASLKAGKHVMCTVPGIVAHQSSLKNGECMKIPQFDEV